MKYATLKTFSPKAALLAACAFAVTSASASTGSDVLGVAGPLKKLQEGLTSVSGILVTLGIIAVAMSFLMSEHGTPFKTAVRIIGAGAAILGAGVMTANLFGSGMLV